MGFIAFRTAMAGMTALTPQEAYYWTWSRFPDISYYDHPPLVSYSIGITTWIFGNTTFGVKMAAVLWSLGWNLLWLRLIRDMFDDPRLAWWSLLVLNSTLLYELYALGPTPDAPLLFGWTGTLWAVWRATHSRGLGWWLLAGIFLGTALLGKYSAILLLPAVGLYLLAPSRRPWLLHPGPWLALALALLLFAPVLYWNAQHDWSSLAFQSSRRLGEMSALKPRFFALLLATQTLLLTPWVMWLSLRGLWGAGRAVLASHADAATTLLWCSALVPLAVFGSASFLANGKLNWLIPAWWPLVVLGLRQSLSRPAAGLWRPLGLASTLALLLAASVLATQADMKLPADLNVASGWRQAAARVDEQVAAERLAGRRAFVFSPNYKISSLIWIHRPSQERTYSSDIWGGKSLQYDHFPKDENLAGATGFLVLSDQAQSNIDMTEVARRFESLEWVETMETRSRGALVRRIEIWRGENYAGSAAQSGN